MHRLTCKIKSCICSSITDSFESIVVRTESSIWSSIAFSEHENRRASKFKYWSQGDRVGDGTLAVMTKDGRKV